MSLRVLITCHELAERAGTQLYTRDVAEELQRRGHQPVVYSPRLGAVAEELRSRGIPVVRRVVDAGTSPDVIHGQHHVETMTAVTAFPAVPAIFVCHGVTPWQEAPPRFPTIVRYAAVDEIRRQRILATGVDPADVEIVHNFVDLERFRLRGSPLPDRPRRALFFSNQAGGNGFTEVVREACASFGIELDVAGVASGRRIECPEDLLPDYDLVFARGRSALEAMATGAAVILSDVEGTGPLVTVENFETLRNLNFGIGALGPTTRENVARQIARYDASAAREVSARVRELHSRTGAVDSLLRIYASAIAARHRFAATSHPADCLAAVSRYLESALVPVNDDASRENDAVYARLAASLAETRTVLETLERSPLMRIRRRLLDIGGVAPLYRRLALRNPPRRS